MKRVLVVALDVISIMSGSSRLKIGEQRHRLVRAARRGSAGSAA
jgi:hypothetical protein